MLQRDHFFCNSVHEVSQIRILTHSPYPKMCQEGRERCAICPFLFKYLCFSLFISKKECCVLIGTQE